MPNEQIYILCVEDNPTDFLLIEDALQCAPNSEFQLSHAKRLSEAFPLLLTRQFHIVLLDLGLPDSLGLETFLQMHSRCPDTPIIVLSGTEDDNVALDAVKEGAQDFLLKVAINGRLLARSIHYAIERFRTSKTLTASEESYRRLFETSQDGIFLLDGNTGTIIDANPFLEKMLGWSVSDLVGRRLWEIAPFRELSASRVAFQTLQEQGPISHDEILLRTRDGKQLIVEFSTNIYAVANRKVIHCNVHDITDRFLAKELMDSLAQRTERQERMLTTALSSTSDFVHINDRVGRFLFANQPTLELLGLTLDKLVGKTLFEIDYPKGLAQQLHDQFDQVFETAKTFSSEIAFTVSTGQERIYEYIYSPVFAADGSVEFAVAVTRDVTDRKRYELEIISKNRQIQVLNEELEARVERRTADLVVATLLAEKANNSKSEFLSRMSQELRTPLNAILGFGQILDLEDLGPISSESVTYILKAGHHLLGLINEVLDLASVEAGGTELSIEAVCVSEVIDEALSLVKPLTFQQNIDLVLSISCDESSHVNADNQRLKQVLINLISNAIKYNRYGGRVDVSWATNADNMMQIRVVDTGFGIHPDNLTKLFKPFERLEFGSSPIQGTGLGLVLSRRLVEAMGGQLTVTSEPDIGSIFSVELPEVAAVPRLQRKAGSTAQTSSMSLVGDYTILAIEDNLSNLRLLEAILKCRPGISLLSAMQGSVGLDFATQFVPDVILLDLNLPDMTDTQVLEKLKAAQVTRDIPVIIVSADAMQSQIQRLLSAGANDYMTKPYDVQQLLKLIDSYLPVHTEDFLKTT